MMQFRRTLKQVSAQVSCQQQLQFNQVEVEGIGMNTQLSRSRQESQDTGQQSQDMMSDEDIREMQQLKKGLKEREKECKIQEKLYNILQRKYSQTKQERSFDDQTLAEWSTRNEAQKAMLEEEKQQYETAKFEMSKNQQEIDPQKVRGLFAEYDEIQKSGQQKRWEIVSFVDKSNEMGFWDFLSSKVFWHCVIIITVILVGVGQCQLWAHDATIEEGIQYLC